MTALLEALEPEFGGGKVFRPYRDVRFSADKSPYKTSIAATAYREAVADDGSGGELEKIIDAIERRHIQVTGHDVLKSAPRGYPKDHPRLELLRYKGLVAWQEWPVAPWLGTAAAKERIVKFLRHSRPLHDWRAKHAGQGR